MCGIDGIVRLRADAPPIAVDELVAVRDRMAHRGPDGAGTWLSPDGLAGLAQRRLAILDLAPSGAQPMVSDDGEDVLVVNGEIYDFAAHRARLERDGVRLRSSGDTAVLLELLRRDGVAALGAVRGMFALAWWNVPRRRLVLARDPLGVKPLYLARTADSLRFASEVRALVAGAGLSRAIDPAGLAGFLVWGAVPEPFTIRRAVRALPAGHLLEIVDGVVGEPRPYALTTPAAEGDAVAAIARSVAAHLVSDVPVATFLSAGIDSGLVASLAARAGEPPTTITVRFDRLLGTDADEGPLAAEVARRLGTRHLERTLGAADVADVWSGTLAAMDQPSLDGFNTWLVTRVAHEAGFKVVLSGLGGDEILGGYPSFRDVPRWAAAGRALGRVPGARAAWPAIARAVAPGRPKLAGVARRGSTAGAYLLRRAVFLPEELPALLGPELAAEALAAYDAEADAGRWLAPEAALPSTVDRRGTGDPWLAVHRLETALYLRNQLLRDADWASMAHSVELRVPFVDARLHRELAALDFAPARHGGKAALLRTVRPDLPAELFTRRKTGFHVPVADWLGLGRTRERHPARALARRLLAELGIPLAGAAPEHAPPAAAETTWTR